MILFLILIGIVALSAFLFLRQPQFGKAPSGERLQRILKSPHYKDGRFDNLNPTPQLAEDTSMPEVMFRFLFGKYPNKIPQKAFKFEKTDLKSLDPNENVFIWMGHSSYFLQIDGKKSSWIPFSAVMRRPYLLPQRLSKEQTFIPQMTFRNWII